MRIIVESEGYQLVIEEDMLDHFALSIPSDVHHYPGGSTELGRTHIVLTGLFKEGVRPEWREINE